MIGKSVSVLFPSERREHLAQTLERIRRGQRIESYDTTRKTKDGRIIDVSLTISPVKDAHGNVVGASTISHNISDRKQLEAELRNHDARLTAVLESSVDFIWSVDKEYRLILGNSAYHTQTKKAIGHVYAPGECVLDAPLPDEIREQWRSTYDRALQGESFTVETQMEFSREPRYTEYRYQPSPMPTVILSAWLALVTISPSGDGWMNPYAKARRLHGYFHLSGAGICVTSPDKGWVEVNDRLCQMLGYAREELMGLTWAELTHPDDLNADLALFHQVLAGERNDYELDKRFVRKDGTIIYTTLSVTSARNPDGTVRHILAHLIDISERKRIEEELRRSKEAFQNYFNLSGAGIGVTSPEHGWLAVNERMCQMLGYSQGIGAHDVGANYAPRQPGAGPRTISPDADRRTRRLSA
ncbi:MAG: PAS domain S-box protein [Anaerolineales bacterium]|nr:PAS domain S-box protein [Anaerolineales bacterium]